MDLPRESCLGCAVCVDVCPSSILGMDYDSCGFHYPVINESECNSCEMCVNHCPILVADKAEVVPEPTVYAAYNLDLDVVYSSSSGGVFTELASAVINQGGAVAGAAFKPDFFVEHVIIERLSDINRLRQSKYTQSSTLGIYSQIKEILDSGRMLLFSGTPCQCAAVSAYLGKPYENLYLCDLICRGVNSDLAYKKYLEWLKSKHGADICSIKIRDKTEGWQRWGIRVGFANGQEYFSWHKADPFMQGFLADLYLRPCCTQCLFKGAARQVDITLGDFWGIQGENEEALKHGISAVLVHSNNGHALFDSIKDKLYWRVSNVEACVRKNPMLVKSALKNSNSQVFYLKIQTQEDFEAAIKNMILNI